MAAFEFASAEDSTVFSYSFSWISASSLSDVPNQSFVNGGKNWVEGRTALRWEDNGQRSTTGQSVVRLMCSPAAASRLFPYGRWRRKFWNQLTTLIHINEQKDRRDFILSGTTIGTEMLMSTGLCINLKRQADTGLRCREMPLFEPVSHLNLNV